MLLIVMVEYLDSGIGLGQLMKDELLARWVSLLDIIIEWQWRVVAFVCFFFVSTCFSKHSHCGRIAIACNQKQRGFLPVICCILVSLCIDQ